MIVVVSPYHLASREIPALAGLLLATRAVTFVPGPESGTRASVIETATREAWYRGFMESWRWSIPLWRTGVIASVEAGADIDAARLAMLHAEGALGPLRALARHDEGLDEARRLAAIGRDIVRGGPDPGLCVPVAAGLDALASRQGYVVARPEPASAAQRAERALASVRFTIGVPVLARASGEAIARARDRLARPLDALRSGLARAFDDARAPRDEAADLAREFDRLHTELTSTAHPDEERVVAGFATITGVELPLDAVLRSSALAAERAGLAPASREATEPVPADAPRVRSILVRWAGRSEARAPGARAGAVRRGAR